jgi:SAM-dependent methyltransferase
MMGRKVTGVDLVTERVELARSRFDYFQSQCDFPLEVDFRSVNIFGLLQKGDMFDAIWVMEAISHIHPAEEFLSLARQRLTEGGRLIISDPNRISPLAWLRSVKIRGSLRHKPHQRFKDPETGQPVDYGQERIFSVIAARMLLRRFGFRVQEVHVTGFMGTSLLPRRALEKRNSLRLLSSLDKAAKHIPVLKSLGSIYTIVAVKADAP